MPATKQLYISRQNQCVDYDCQENVIIAIIEAADTVHTFLTQTGDGLSGATAILTHQEPGRDCRAGHEARPHHCPQLSATSAI